MWSQILQFFIKRGLKTAYGKELGLKKLALYINAPNSPILLCIVGELAGGVAIDISDMWKVTQDMYHLTPET